MASRTKQHSSIHKTCNVRGCGRPLYARGFCQTHHKQFLATGTTGPIRRYRRSTGPTVKYSGLRVTPGCAKALDDFAQKHNLSRGAAIADVLETWNRNRRS